MSNLRTLVDEVAALVGAVVPRTVTSPQNINPPCALVGAPYDITAQYALGTEVALSCTVPVVLMARGLGDDDLTWLYQILPSVMAAMSATTANPTPYQMSDGRELPAFTIDTEMST